MRPRDAAAAATAAILAVLLLLPGLGHAPFDDPGEGQHVEIAREAWLSGDWLTLRLNGVRYFDKPPLLYWMVASGLGLGGAGEWGARLAPLAGAVLAVAGTACLGSFLLGPAAGLVAGAALLSSGLFAFYGRYVRPETLFLAAIQWGLTGLLLGWRERSRAWAIVGCAALGLAALVKDPLGLVGPVAAVALALGLARAARPVSRWLPLTGVVLLLAIGLAWYAAAALTNPGFAWYTVVDNHVLNAARLRRFPDEDVPLSALEFMGVAMAGALPWTIAAAAMTIALWRRRAWRDAGEAPWMALALWGWGVVALFAALPFRLPHYGMPAYAAMALLAARYWQEARAAPRRACALHLALLVPLAALLAWAALGDGPAFADLVFGVSDVHTRKLSAAGQAATPVAWAALRPLAGAAALACAAGSLGLAVAFWRRNARLGLAAVLVCMFALVPLVGAAGGRVASANAVKVLAGEVAREARPSDVVVHEGPIEASAALELYSGRRPVLLDATRSVLGMGATFPDSAGMFWDRDRFSRAWLGGCPLILVTPRPPARSAVAGLPRDRVRLVLAHNGRWLYRSVPAPGAPAPLGCDR
jgi:4-amino-4-deoxy-L-arabinose transferase-like glycosyltransferase